MRGRTLLIGRTARRGAFALGAAGLLALAGCKSDKEAPAVGVGRRNDPLMAREGRLLPPQNLPVPERGLGSKGKDPLTAPTGGRGERSSYNDDQERFKGTVMPGTLTTPASLAGRIRDGEELKIESPGVELRPTAGAAPSDTSESVSGLYDRLERMGVKRQDRSLELEDGLYVFRAAVLLNSAEGTRRQYTGQGKTPYEAVKQVVDQLAERK
ncbi:hypothetical protein R5W23_000359 [Gemmata sp. JC673]|uniref:Lipoprotein n=1 Tax=Gemmata algarum TaxID=2975278 RepID=A0ABU5EY41_9BACT|nr:hypothetical protein [Gemmata algarum]MDY3559367.1 hypothetical protein [Gemmata algarum]